MIIEWGYNLYDACGRYSHDPRIGLFFGILQRSPIECSQEAHLFEKLRVKQVWSWNFPRRCQTQHTISLYHSSVYIWQGGISYDMCHAQYWSLNKSSSVIVKPYDRFITSRSSAEPAAPWTPVNHVMVIGRAESIFSLFWARFNSIITLQRIDTNYGVNKNGLQFYRHYHMQRCVYWLDLFSKKIDKLLWPIKK